METSDENQINKIVFSDEVQSAIEQVAFKNGNNDVTSK